MSSRRLQRAGIAAVMFVTTFASTMPPARAAIGPNGLIAYSAWEGVERDIYTVDPPTGPLHRSGSPSTGRATRTRIDRRTVPRSCTTAS